MKEIKSLKVKINKEYKVGSVLQGKYIVEKYGVLSLVELMLNMVGINGNVVWYWESEYGNDLIVYTLQEDGTIEKLSLADIEESEIQMNEEFSLETFDNDNDNEIEEEWKEKVIDETIKEFNQILGISKALTLKVLEEQLKGIGYEFIVSLEDGDGEYIQIKGKHFDYSYSTLKAEIKQYNGEYISLEEFKEMSYEELTDY